LLGIGVFLADMPVQSASNSFFQQEQVTLQEVSLISVYDNYQVKPELKNCLGLWQCD